MSQPTRILLALALGLLVGISSAAQAPESFTAALVAIADPIGGLWLDALQMTIIPLVVSLLITGIAATADAARSGLLALRALLLFLVVLWTSSLLGAVLFPAFVALWPLPASGGAALSVALGATEQPATDIPGVAAFLRSVIPTNPVAAAAADSILPLIIFTAIFGFALTRLPAEPRGRLTGFFGAVADTMLVVIGWVLWISPIGVFALAVVLGAAAGSDVVKALIHYVVITSAVGGALFLLAYPLAHFGGGVRLGAFARAVAPAQAVAISTRSSLATLPTMLASAERLGVPVHAADVVLPLAVALFRATGPAMNVAVALYVAHWLGMELGPMQVAAGVAVACITTFGAVSLPGQVSFITSIGPISVAMGVPIEPLALLLAVETLPDTMRTIGNVTMDVAVTTVAARDEPALPGEERTSDGVTP
jgi:Na+/H+-dicarboxylate symporter